MSFADDNAVDIIAKRSMRTQIVFISEAPFYFYQKHLEQHIILNLALV